MKLYTQYVRPHLETASPAWSPWTIGDRAALEKVQETAVKMVTGLKGITYEERCAKLTEFSACQMMAMLQEFCTK